MNTTREIGTAVTTRARVRITEGSGYHKGVTGIALGYNAQYDSIKVGFIDANGNYTGDYTTVAVQHVEVIESAPETTREATEAAPELPTTNTPAPARRQKSTRTARRNKAAAILRTRSAHTRLTASLRRGRSLATHAIAAGVDIADVPGVVNGLRTVAKRLHVEPVKTSRTHRTITWGVRTADGQVLPHGSEKAAVAAVDAKPGTVLVCRESDAGWHEPPFHADTAERRSHLNEARDLRARHHL